MEDATAMQDTLSLTTDASNALTEQSTMPPHKNVITSVLPMKYTVLRDASAPMDSTKSMEYALDAPTKEFMTLTPRPASVGQDLTMLTGLVSLPAKLIKSESKASAHAHPDTSGLMGFVVHAAPTVLTIATMADASATTTLSRLHSAVNPTARTNRNSRMENA